MATFYNVKKREKVEIEDTKLTKKKYSGRGGDRYAIRAVDDDGTNLTKFVSKDTFDSMDVTEE